MANDNKLMIIDESTLKDKIYTIRGQQVMLDSDLAMIYGYEVKRLNEQVKYNTNRFPEDFMFQITKEEINALRSDFSTANINPKSRSHPHVFTEQGIYISKQATSATTRVAPIIRKTDRIGRSSKRDKRKYGFKNKSFRFYETI